MASGPEDLDLDALEAAGCYDPTAPDAPEQRELLEHLVERGATLELIQRRLSEGDELFMVATSLTHEWPPLRSVAELAAAGGSAVELVARMRLALGFGVDDVHGPSVHQTLPEDVALLQMATDLYGEERVLAFTRVLGASATRIADAANALFGDRMGEDPGQRPSLLELSQANELALVALEAVPSLLGRAVVEHLGDTLRRLPDLIEASVRTAVGFVDLVGSTRWATTLTMRDHASALGRFESAAWECATRHGGRVVKMIGDEAMVVADSVEGVARVAVELCQQVAADPDLPPARGAVGFGPVTTRAGDYFGPIVNAVARATKVAEPGGVVVLSPAHEVLVAAGWSTSPLSTVELRGLDHPVDLATLTPPSTA